MIISFIPVFALTGMEGKMFHPLAYTKSFALIGVSVLSITLVPAIIPWLLRGRIRHETDSWLVRRVIEVYRPVLNYVMDHPWPVVWIVGVICLLGATAAGSIIVLLSALALTLGLAAWSAVGEESSVRRHWLGASITFALISLVPFGIAWLGDWRPAIVPKQILELHPAIFWLSVTVVALLLSISLGWLLSRLRLAATLAMVSSLVLVALIGQRQMTPL
jgi:uncharacterized membrane protein YdfJ with MMPL/SSD domain